MDEQVGVREGRVRGEGERESGESGRGKRVRLFSCFGEGGSEARRRKATQSEAKRGEARRGEAQARA